MADLELRVTGWLGSSYGSEEVRATTGSLQITAGEGLTTTITDVEDTIGQTVRSHINVPLVSLAEWLLMNWWRLRWESRPARMRSDWRRSHTLSAIGGDDAWPSLEISSDGSFVQLQMEAENAADVAAIRYLRTVAVNVPATEFEAAVERFVDVVEARLSSIAPGYRGLSELRAELADERRRSSVATTCRLQALAGIDPGAAPDGWLDMANAVVEDAGAASADEIMTAVPDLEGGLSAAEALIDGMKHSSTTVDLSWVRRDGCAPARELPWQTGTRLASDLRHHLHLDENGVADAKLAEMLSTTFPLQGELSGDAALAGGFRNGVMGGRTKITCTSHRPESQRFYLARLIGAAHVLGLDQHVVPVTKSNSALQKIERAFAQELLCPWAALEAFTDEHGLDDEALADAAEYFRVSQLLVRTTLVNRGKLGRGRLSVG